MIPSHFFLAMQAMVLAVLPAANGPVSEPSDMGRVVSVADFGAKGDGATDDTAAVQAAAVAAAGGTLKFPHRPAAYRITGTVTIRGSTRVIGDDSKILMALGPDHPTGRLFYVAGDDVEIGGLWIDASGANPRVTGNRYAIAIVGTAERHLRNVHVRNCKFTNLPWADAKAVIATHALYNKWADLSTVENCIADAVAGAAVFVSQSNGVRIINNDINNTGWYSIQLQDRVEGALVSGNRITGTVPGGRMWGGSVNLMSNGRDLGAGKARIKRVLITGNEISGVHSYTGAIQIESSSYISFNHNKMADISLTNKLPPAYVRVYTRPQGDKTDEGASDNIDVSDNTLIARGPDCIGVYVDNQRFGGQTGYASGLSVRKNMVTSPDESNTFSHAVIVHGQAGGWKDVEIVGNNVSGRPLPNPQAGLIGVVGRPSAPVRDVLISENSLHFVGKPTQSAHVGIAIEGYVEHVIVRGNNVQGFWHGIRTFPNSHFIDVEPTNSFTGSASANTLLVEQSDARTAATLSPVPHHFSVANAESSKDAADAIMGTATLAAGTASIKTKKVTTNSRILLSEITRPSVPVDLRVSARTAGESFTITSSNGSDNSTVAWLIMDVTP